jgi:hypothetical protein
MDKILEPWLRKRAVIVGGLQINNRLIREGKTWEDVREFLESNKSISKTIIHKSPKKCPDCGKPLNGSDLHKNSEKYKEGYRSYWLCGASCCTGKGCGYEEYSTLTVRKEHEKHLGGFRRKEAP